MAGCGGRIGGCAALAAVVGAGAIVLGAGGGDPEAIDAPSIENLYRLAPGLYSGAQPVGEAGFSALRRLGVRTIISVDGARPEVEAARAQGLRYVHLPVGYDGIDRDQAERLVRAARGLPGPVFVHCHHGTHRGPAAAAIVAMATAGWPRERARRWLEQAGTSRDYKGLFASVERFDPAAALARADGAPPEDFPEAAEVPALVEMMVRIDAGWDRLRAIGAAGFRAPAESPDLDPAHEALMLAEQFREAARLDEARERGEAFVELMAAGDRASMDLAGSLKPAPPRPGESARALERVGRSCVACHRRFRDD